MKSEEEIKKEIAELEEKLLSCIGELIEKLKERKSGQKSEKSKDKNKQFLEKRFREGKIKLKLLQVIFKEFKDK